MRSLSVVALLSLAGAAFAGGGLPVINADLDNNGMDEMEGTYLRRVFANPGVGGSISVNFAFMTSEDFDTVDYQDIFRIRVLDITRGGAVMAEYGGAVGTKGTYSGNFDIFDFSNPDLEGTVHAPAAGSVHGVSHFFNDGLLGWRELQYVIPGDRGESEGDGLLMLEFLVADSGDTAVESGLAIDNVRVNDASGAPIPEFENGGFENLNLGGWNLEGEGGVYTFLNQAPNNFARGEGDYSPAFFAQEGNAFALITTEIPAPGAVCVGALAALAALRRRR